MSPALIACAVVTAVSAFVSLGFALAALRGASGAQLTASRYALVRSLALLVVAVVASLSGRAEFVVLAGIAMTLVQAGDGVVGLGLKDRAKTWGPFLTAALNAAALLWAIGSGALS